MDEVTFSSSGAISRPHYALVRKVEEASTPQLAQDYVSAEVEEIRARLTRPRLSLRHTRECLVILLYCISVSPRIDLHFALLHAINLAEAGETVQDKRTGYLFCSEIMPAGDEMQLMLVNTLRKDLENPSVPHNCLALDTLITSSSEDVVPAVQSRLHDLLSHNSPHVRRRALLAIRALAQYEPALLTRVASKAQKRLRDADAAVAHAALVVCAEIFKVSPEDSMRDAVNHMFYEFAAGKPDKASQRTLVHVLPVLRLVGPSEEHIPLLGELVRFAAKHQARPLLHAAFMTLSSCSTPAPTSPAKSIRRLLTSADPNERYLFLSSLNTLDPTTWAGTNPEVPAVLEAWEVERVMQQLDSKDSLIRKTTLNILRAIDPEIVGSYYAQSVQGVPEGISIASRNEYATRLLEILELQSSGDGEIYAGQLKEICTAVEAEAPQVLDAAVDVVLTRVREGTGDFRIACAVALIVLLCEKEAKLGPTLLVIVAALACEFCEKVSVSAEDILRGFGERMSSCPASVQDACLLAMLRVLAICNDVPTDLVQDVVTMGQSSGRHIRRRCDQFAFMAAHKDVLHGITVQAQSSSLPDFLVALEAHQAMINPPHSPRPSSSRPLSPRSPPRANKLRYDAYAAPQIHGQQRRYSDKAESRAGSSRPSSRLSGSTREDEGRSFEEPLSRTVTAGDLAIAGASGELTKVKQKRRPFVVDSSANNRPDLIAFDSPFMSEPEPAAAAFHLDSTTPFEPQESLESLQAPSTSEESSSQLSDSLEDANLVFESTRGSPFEEPATSLEPEPESRSQSHSHSLASSHYEETFEHAWDAMESTNTRGWCEMSIDGVVRQIQSLVSSEPGVRITVIPVDRTPFEGDLKVMVLRNNGLHAALRLRESDDESCLWRMRSDDDELRLRIKRLLSEG